MNTNETRQCRRCSECEGCDHHWLDNPDFGNDTAEADGPTEYPFVCKHCPAVGDFGEPCDDNDDECEIVEVTTSAAAPSPKHIPSAADIDDIYKDEITLSEEEFKKLAELLGENQ